MASSSASTFEPSQNRLLALLTAEDCEALLPDLESVMLPVKAYLYEPHEPLTHAYFPISGLVSIMAATGDGSTVEVGPAGWDGMVGLPLFLGTVTDPLETFVQVGPVQALRVGADAFRRHVDQRPSLRAVLMRYVQWTYVGMAQWILCARLHTAEERMARWLLMTQDRVRSEHLPLTHEFLAGMLGTQRPTVTLAAGVLQRSGLIRYTRGAVDILDRKGLEDVSCDCYQISVAEYERLFGTSLRPDGVVEDPPCDRCGADTLDVIPVRGGDGAETSLPLCPQCRGLLERGLRVLRPKAGNLDPRVLRLSAAEARRYVQQGLLVLKVESAIGQRKGPPGADVPFGPTRATPFSG